MAFTGKSTYGAGSGLPEVAEDVADLVAINHPGTAYTEDDLRDLTGYHLMEVVNGPFGFEELWDAALSSGHVIWALANDDIHDLTNLRRLAVAWNMIDSPSPGLSDIVSALRDGDVDARRSSAFARELLAEGFFQFFAVFEVDGNIDVARDVGLR